jgi:ABC-type multidrug transport system fused ATPase/permease subunit
MVQQWLSVVLKLVILGLAVALTALALKLRSTSGFTGVALVNLMSLNEMIMAVLYGWMLLETSISAVCRVKEFEEQTPQELDEESLGKGKVGESWPPMGKVECNDLKASYG